MSSNALHLKIGQINDKRNIVNVKLITILIDTVRLEI